MLVTSSHVSRHGLEVLLSMLLDLLMDLCTLSSAAAHAHSMKRVS